MRNQDEIIKFLAYDGQISITCARTTNLVEKARELQDLSPVVTAALGRLLTITCILGNNLKNETDKITVQIKGDGPIHGMVAVANNKAEVKGYALEPIVDIPLKREGKLDVGTAVGKNGFLNVIKDIGLKEPYRGMVPLVSGEIAEDFARYFAESEQTGTAVALGVLVDKNGVKSAGGYVITVMPDAKEETIQIIEKNLQQIEPISSLLEQDIPLEQIAKKVTGEENLQVIQNNKVPTYTCNCSKEKIKKVLVSLGKQELEKILEEDKKAEIVCHFCNTVYVFTEEELKEMIKEPNNNF